MAMSRNGERNYIHSRRGGEQVLDGSLKRACLG